jgi:hypothetical protein
LSRRFFDDIQAHRRVRFHPCISPLFLPLVHANLSQRKRLMMCGQEPFGAFGIRNIGGMHQHPS